MSSPFYLQKLFAATNNLSDVSFVAPYKLIGEEALSVDKATTLETELYFYIALLHSLFH